MEVLLTENRVQNKIEYRQIVLSSGADPGFQKGGWMADHIYWREVRGFLLGNWTMPTMSKDFR